MNIWDLLLWAALAATIGSGISYAAASGRSPLARKGAKGRNDATKTGRILMLTSLVLLLAASAGLLTMFLKHDFRYRYVVYNSNRGLDSLYLVSAFWAGQEGSLLLWALFSALFGCLLMFTSKDQEESVMPWYALAQASLMIVAVRMSPFTMLAEAAADGVGLNPLLLNPWMAIHPPIVFAGYAAITAPFALAMGALTRKDYKGWIKSGIWWNLLAWLLLGAGIMIGAKWAYAVLGWGGYWGWDPVENASLVPWIFGAALLHTMLSQKTRGKMVRTNIALAIITFLLIGYGTFLTRSGVLSDFSVHSFADLGISSYLLLYLALTGIPALVLYIARFKDMTASRKYTEVYEKITSRDFGMFIGAAVLLSSAFITLLGTSAPILTRLFGEPQAVDTSFYNITNYPLGVLIALLMGIFPLFRWGIDELKSARGGLIASLAVAVAGTVAIFAAGGKGIAYLAFMAAAIFGLIANLYMLARVFKGGLKHMGGYLTHLGVAIVFAGIITTGGWAVTERAMIPIGGSVEASGLRIEASAPVTSVDGLTISVPLKVYRNNALYEEGETYMQQTRMNSTLRHPLIHSTLFEDVYISPLALQQSSAGLTADHGIHLDVIKGGNVTSGPYSISFSAFDLSGMNEGKVGASIVVSESGRLLFDGKLFVSVAGGSSSAASTVLEGASGKARLTLQSVDASTGTIHLDLVETSAEAADAQEQSQLLVEVSRKPFVSLLWIGAVLIILGTTLALGRRFLEAR